MGQGSGDQEKHVKQEYGLLQRVKLVPSSLVRV